MLLKRGELMWPTAATTRLLWPLAVGSGPGPGQQVMQLLTAGSLHEGSQSSVSRTVVLAMMGQHTVGGIFQAKVFGDGQDFREH